MLEKTEKIVNIKRNSRNYISVVREHYLRDDIPCKSPCCPSTCKQPKGFPQLPKDATHYIIPDCQIARKYLEIFQLKELTGVIFLQTVMNYIQQKGGKRGYKQITGLCKDPTKNCVLFNNEFHEACYVERKHGGDLEEWRTQMIYSSAKWYRQHLKQNVSIVIVTEDVKMIEKYDVETFDIFLLSMKDYLQDFLPDSHEARDLQESLSSVEEANLNVGASICKEFQEYYPMPVLEAGVKSGRFVSSYLKVNKHRPTHEAFVQTSDSRLLMNAKGSMILIPGTALRNRAIDGDLVVVEVLPESEWQSKSSSISQSNEDAASTNADSSSVMTTGRIVGIMQRNTRDYVVGIPQDDKSNDRSSKILTVPWDCRIPKIRISTRQQDKLKNERFIVRIDSWETNSLYPNGHFVRSLGVAGHIETEISALLVEHGLSVTPFSGNITNEMPTNSKDEPWKMDDAELKRRRDLRKSHLIFSIDPKGCEDVDDTLSVKKLSNGNWELGVHIADVTYFVEPNSFTDLEARSRTTTIYLADRRYDMLPAILSSDLCSLISDEDRYAVSVMWELDTKCDVINVWYGRTIIRSKYKLFYEAAQQISDGGVDVNTAAENIPELERVKIPEERQKKFEELSIAIKNLIYIARELKSKRAQKGAIDLESSEVQIQINEEKEIKELTPKQPLEVHETIAECMIFANHWVAKRIKDTYKTNSILRNHPAPNQDYFTSIRDCASAKGFAINTSTNHLLAKSLGDCVDDDPNTNKIFRILSTQAMMVATYFSTGSINEEDFQHYGLALQCYTHFTSPIRRYADILVHRLLLASLDDPLVNKELLLGNNELQELCQHINIKHREADTAQKDSVKFFQAIYFKSHSKDDAICVADAMVYSLRVNGVLVFIPKFGIKGAVFLKDKSGNVAGPSGKRGDDVEFSAGCVEKHRTKLVIKCANGKCYSVHLFSYLKVRIITLSSSMHADRLHLELVSLSVKQFEINNSVDGNIKRSELIQDVKKSKEEEKKLLDDLHESPFDHDMTNMKQRYGQTHKDVSMYEMFRAFKMNALQPKIRKKK